MTPQDRWLLPDGIEEILPEEARALERLRREVLDLFDRWGYELVMPPLVEYLESLLTGVGGELDLQTFKLIDQMTGRLLGVRADITPQAARIDAHYLKRSGPARLCYVGSVLRTRPDELGGTREPLQLGAELYGSGHPAADAEVLTLMVATLRVAGIQAPHVDLGHVGVFRALATHAALDAEREVAVFEVLQRKARTELEALLAQYGTAAPARARLLALLDLNGGEDVLKAARERLRGAPAAIGEALDNLEAVVLAAQSAGMPALHFDLAELAGYHYYTGVVFSAFVPGHGRAVCRGGRYDGIGRGFGRERAATGFGADLRALARLGTRAAAASGGILAPVGGDAGFAREIERLRSAGERVVARLPGDDSPAAAFGCDRQLVNRDGRWVIEEIKTAGTAD
jgi:ATP phosphoribosyltransferase regulatory subunit